MVDGQDDLEKIVDQLTTLRSYLTNDGKIKGSYYEEVAIEAIMALPEIKERASLIGQKRRRGDPLTEPDWIFEDGDGEIIAGFEVTEIDIPHIRIANAKLEDLKQGKPLKSKPGKPAADLAIEASTLAGGDEHALSMQKIIAKIILADLIKLSIERIEDKKTRGYHHQEKYPVHLVLHDYKFLYLIVDGEKIDALKEIAKHDRGNFAMLWHIDNGLNVTRLASGDDFQQYKGSLALRQKQLSVSDPSSLSEEG